MPVGSAQASIYFRSTSSATTASAASITLDAPTDTTAGDFLIMDIDTNGGSTAFSPPSGWTSAYAGTNYSGGTLGGGYTVVAYKVAAAADVGATYTISLGTARAAVGRILDYVGVETSNPVENTFPLGTDPSGGAAATSFSYPSVTTTASNSLVVFGAVAFHSGGATPVTPPTGSTSRLEAHAVGTSPDIIGDDADLVQASAGTVAKTGKIGASSPWGAITIALDRGAGALSFDLAPSIPALGTVKLKGEAEKTFATMGVFAVDDTLTESGWNVSVRGNTGEGKSPVFKQYCENGSSACGSTPAHSYVSAGFELPAGSLSLNTTGASWTTGSGLLGTPAFQCGSGCALDGASQAKIVSAAEHAGLGAWVASGLSSTSVVLSTPSTVHALPEHEVYHEDLLWTLSSGP
jgi:hypothetical protein